jgi:hypothetical protein
MGKERRGYVVLAMMSVCLSLFVLLFGAIQENRNNHRFCDVFNTLISSSPAPQPADPKKDPSRARSYDIYIKFVALDKSLGC